MHDLTGRAKTFDARDERAQALLGTPNGSGVAWVLIQRKRYLGIKVVDKVTMFVSVFTYDEGDRTKVPNLLFHIKDVVQK